MNDATRGESGQPVILAEVAQAVGGKLSAAAEQQADCSLTLAERMIPDIDAQYRGTYQATLSPDGKRLAFVGNGLDGTRRIWLRGSDSLETRPLDGTEDTNRFTFSTTGDVIYFTVEHKLKGVVVDGGLPFDIATLANAANHLSASSTGSVLVTSDKEVVLVSKPGTNPLSVMKVGDQRDDLGLVVDIHAGDRCLAGLRLNLGLPLCRSRLWI